MSHRTLLFASALLGASLSLTFAGCGSSGNSGSGGTGDGGEDGTSSSSGGSSGGGSGGSGSGGSSGGSSGSSSGGGSGSSSGGGSGSSSGGGSGGSSGGSSSGACVPPKTGKQLVKSATTIAEGVTSDGYAIYYDTAAKNLMAVSTAGGAPITVGPWDASFYVYTYGGNFGPPLPGGATIFWSNTGTVTPAIGTLTVWTKTHGAKVLANNSFATSGPGGGQVDVSADGKYVLYTDNATTTAGDVYVAGIDGTGKTLLVKGAAYSPKATPQCYPYAKFVGTAAVVASCTGTTSGAATIQSFSGATWATKKTLGTGAFFYFSADDAGTQIAYAVMAPAKGDGGVKAGQFVQALAGGPATLIDALGFGYGGATFSSTGTDLFYLHNANAKSPAPALYRSAIGTPKPQVINAGPFEGIYPLSKDDKWIGAYNTTDSTGATTDLTLMSTAPGSTAYSMATAGAALYGDAYTTDNSHALFFTSVSGGSGNYEGEAMPPTGANVMLGTLVWQEYATGGTKTVYNDNYACGTACNGPTYGTADIESIDVKVGTPTKLATGADANIFMTTDRKTVVYSWNACTNAAQGVWAVAAP